MTADREIAEAISDGINCLHAMIGHIDSGAYSIPDPAWPNAIGEMERALERVMALEVTTSMSVAQEDLNRIRAIRDLVSAWKAESQALQELRTLAQAALRSLGFTGLGSDMH